MNKNWKVLFLFLSLALCMSNAYANGLQFDSNIGPDLKRQILDDLSFVNQIKGAGASPLHQRIIGAVDGSVYQAWFESRIFTVAKGDCGGDAFILCLYPSRDPHKMLITPTYTQNDHPQVIRVSLLYHESRHSDAVNNHWQHANCPVPFNDGNGQTMFGSWSGCPLEGLPACDETVYGAYGLQVILLKNIKNHCTNCNLKVKEDAGIYAEEILKRIIYPASHELLKNDL